MRHPLPLSPPRNLRSGLPLRPYIQTFGAWPMIKMTTPMLWTKDNGKLLLLLFSYYECDVRSKYLSVLMLFLSLNTCLLLYVLLKLSLRIVKIVMFKKVLLLLLFLLLLLNFRAAHLFCFRYLFLFVVGCLWLQFSLFVRSLCDL